MPAETKGDKGESKSLADFQSILSSEMDVKEALAGGGLEGLAVRGVGLSRVSFENRRIKDVLIHEAAMPRLNMDDMTVEALQWTNSELRGCTLRYGEFGAMNMMNCVAMECLFDCSTLRDVNFYDSMMTNVSFRSSKLVNTLFQSVEMYGANFSHSFMARCSFSDPKMGNASLTRADFSRAMIIDTSFKDANLYASNFHDAVLIRVDLSGANIAQADMRGAVLLDCKIYTEDRRTALWD